jgi:hypothetical protein
MLGIGQIQVRMLLLQAKPSTATSPYYDASTDAADGELYLNVVFDPKTDRSGLSRAFVQRAQAELGWLFTTGWYDEGTYEELQIRCDLGYRGVRTSVGDFRHVSDAAKLGIELPHGIDALIGPWEVKKMRQAMRRQFLQSGPYKPLFPKEEFGVDPDLCFVLMPFGASWSDRVWRRHIRPSVESAGMKCIRADDLFTPGVIIDDIWRSINRASVVIADLTGRNPNVFYELGLAHAASVPAIIVCQDCESPAFDTAHLRQIRYQDNSEGCEKLEIDLRESLKGLVDASSFP